MMLRTIVCCTALVLGFLVSLGFAAQPADACEGASCPAAVTAKPLDLMKFMHKKTAATRAVSAYAAKPPRGHGHSIAQKRERATAVAQTEPVPLPVEAAKAFASEPDPKVQVVASDEFNDIDRAAGPAPAETNGAAIHADQAVQLVDAEEFNNIDGKAAETVPQPADPSAYNRTGASNVSRMLALWSTWSSWVWSSLSGAVAAVQQLFG